MNSISRIQVKPFSYHKVSDGRIIVYAQKGAFIVTTVQFHKVFQELNAQIGKCLSNSDIMNILNNSEINPEEGQQYLLNEIGLLKPVSFQLSHIKDLVIISDSECVRNSLQKHYNDNKALSVMVRKVPVPIVKENSMVVVFLENYSESFFKEMYEKNAQSENLVYLSSYLLGRHFFIDNVYIPAQANPCHFCNFGWIQGKEARSQSMSPNSFFMLYRYLIEHKIPMAPALPLDNINRGFVVWLLKMHIDQFLGFDEQILSEDFLNRSTSVDLETGKVEKDLTLHWEFCECHTEQSQCYTLASETVGAA